MTLELSHAASRRSRNGTRQGEGQRIARDQKIEETRLVGFLHPKSDLLGALFPRRGPLLRLNLRGGPSWTAVKRLKRRIIRESR